MSVNLIEFINLTPHNVNVVREGEIILVIEPSGTIARCKQETKEIGMLANIPITETVFGEVENLPAPKENTYFIVSRLVLSACKDRKDLLVPNELVRDEEGNIIGCSSFSVN